jgi:protoheme IX farnesyltransferase
MTSSSCDGSWNEQHAPLSHLPHIYMKLSKYRLTSLVVLTSLTGYAMAPPAAPVMSSITLLNACIGTALCSAAANTFNQVTLECDIVNVSIH